MTTVPNLLYTEVEDEVRTGVREVLADRCDWRSVLARTESAEPYDLQLWRLLAGELGFAGLPVPGPDGAGETFRAVAVAMEELGRAVAPIPFLGSAVLATAAALAVEDGQLLGPLATGTVTAALAVSYATPPAAGFPTGVSHAGGTLSGQISGVADAAAAEVLLVPAIIDREPALYAVDAAAATISPKLTLDLTRRLADVRLEAAPGRLLATGASAETALRRALLVGTALLASEQLGVAEQCLETTVAYVKTRYQFGRPVGSFQALKHRLADVWVSVAQARAAARYAAACVSTDDPDAAVAASLAKAYCSTAAVRAAEESVQLHGGIGFTWEHPAHLYLKRAKSTALALGTSAQHRAVLAELVDLPA